MSYAERFCGCRSPVAQSNTDVDEHSSSVIITDRGPSPAEGERGQDRDVWRGRRSLGSALTEYGDAAFVIQADGDENTATPQQLRSISTTTEYVGSAPSSTFPAAQFGRKTRGGVGGMAFYRERVLPRVINVACGMKVAEPLRQRVCEALTGNVVEVGFGSGLNIPFYPEAVTRVSAVEPADLAWRLAGKRLEQSSVPVTRSGMDGQSLPFPDDSFDTALSTWTLCTIPDVDAALGELRRVLKPGGTLHFIEHGLAPDEGVRRWQHRLEPVQKRVFGGCHLTRPVVELLTTAGFVVGDVDVFYEKGAPKPLGADSLGTAASP